MRAFRFPHVSLPVAVTAVLLLVACGGGGRGAQTGASPTPSVSPPAVTPSASASPSGTPPAGTTPLPFATIVTTPPPGPTPIAGTAPSPLRLASPFPAEINGAVLNRLPPGPLDCPAGWQKIAHPEWGFGYCLPAGVPYYSAAWGDDLNTTGTVADFSLLLPLYEPAHGITPNCADGSQPAPGRAVTHRARERIGGRDWSICYRALKGVEMTAYGGFVEALFVTPTGYVVRALAAVCLRDLPPTPEFSGLSDAVSAGAPICAKYRQHLAWLREAVLPSLRALP